MTVEDTEHKHFIRQRIDSDLAAGLNDGRVHTRFPPEPNGYLHLGHAKAICVSFGLATEYGGLCNLRFDDTNPAAEDVEYVDAIEADVRWLGFDWGDRKFFASDYFETLYGYAEQLIGQGDAYVDDQSAEEMRAARGTVTEPGTASPFRDRSVDENLDLFKRMRAGEFDDGAKILRAKIDMASPNLNLRDPALYRIRKVVHHRTGTTWCIYPTYDWAHGQSDSIEGITHSLCTLEFENHRPLYDWCVEKLGIHHPQQIEFARLNVTHTVLSKRWLLQLVRDGHVSGWDDPRMPTLIGMRRRGYTPSALRTFCASVGVAKYNALHEISLLENALREDLNETAPRRMAVLDPLKLVITDWPEGKVDSVEAMNMPGNEAQGTRTMPFAGTLWVERDDVREDAPRKWHRLAIGKEVRLRYGYYVTLQEIIKDADGAITELRCTHDPESRGGSTADERKVRGTIHWVSADHALDAEVRLYDHLFSAQRPGKGEDGAVDFIEHLNPESLVSRAGKLEPSLAVTPRGTTVQFERLGYFCADSKDGTDAAPVWNRTVALRDSWARLEKKTKS